MSEIGISRKIQHLYWRAGFGPLLKSDEKKISGVKAEVEKIFSNAKKYSTIEIMSGKLTLNEPMTAMGKDEKKKQKKQVSHILADINATWFHYMTGENPCLREKMTLFWSGIFACKIQNPFFAQQFNNSIRKHALGKFGDLLIAVSKEPAMLQFLNNQQNRKEHPNENFAREVMELFTLGRGHYSETDVRESARAFTGWAFNKEGNFQFRQGHHDSGMKTFLGQTGNFDGEKILHIILEQKQCARFITGKIYSYFVNDIPDPVIIEQLSNDFYQSGYDIEMLMRKIFSSSWFYEEKNIGVRIKSPCEITANLAANFRIQFRDVWSLMVLQRILGQRLFLPSNVAGWPEGRGWIDSSSLMYRLRLAQVLLNRKEVNFKPKEEFDVQDKTDDSEMLAKNTFRKIFASADWSVFVQQFNNDPDGSLIENIAAFVLQKNIKTEDVQLIRQYTGGLSKEDKIKSIALHLMSMPEFQVC